MLIAERKFDIRVWACLLYTSDAADDMQCVDLGGRRIIKKVRCRCGAPHDSSTYTLHICFFKQKTAYEM